MASLYPKWSNTVYRCALAALALVAVALPVVPMLYARTSYNTKQHTPREQPVLFDHRHHVGDDGIACLYCHPDAETSAAAGVPSTDLCMGCHVQIWSDSPGLATVRASARHGAPIAWVRVNDLADFVYFHHGVHVTAEIACERCHGPVGEMASVVQIAPLTMGWCLDCHRDPRDRGRALEIGSSWAATVDMLTDSPGGTRAITGLTTCTACHR